MPSPGHPAAPTPQAGAVSRRALAKGAAWALPSVAVAGAAPAFAASKCPQLISAPWKGITNAGSLNWGNSNTYVAYVMYPTSNTAGYATFGHDPVQNELATPVAGAATPYPSNYSGCNADCSVQGKVVTVIVDNIGGDDQYSDTPRTWNDLPGRPPEGNAWVYMITQEPDRGENYEVTSHGGFQPQAGSLDNQYVGVKSVSPEGRTRFTWEVTMIAPTCGPGDGAGAIEYQLFYPPHYAPAGQISNPEYRITTISPWGTNVWEH